ncbi:MAG: hypothetical protein IPL65_22030 [Lewinellaceae bacterium]|nr:hypothetical protein [Lewinellaceae bacterium]
MLFLVSSILCSVLLGFLFKLFPRFGIDTFQAIVFNYFTCVAVAWLSSGVLPYRGGDMLQPWWPYAVFLGLIFITGFNAAALTVRYFSVTLSQIMQKMSILLTVPFAILAYHESAGWLKVLGIVLALGAIVLVNWPNKKAPGAVKLGPSWIPILTWVLAAIIEMVFIRVKGEHYLEGKDAAFITTVFGTAGVLGFSYACLEWFNRRRVFAWKHVLAGIVLGIPNYGSMYFLLRALGNGLEGSLVFPLTNVGIILLTTIGAVSLFQEKLTRLNWIGVGLALAAILSISIY